MLAGDIEGNVRGRVVERVKEQAGFEAAARAVLDDATVRAQCIGHFGDVRLEDLKLGAGEVVLGEFTDPVEELGAALVVEEFTGEYFSFLGEAVDDLRAEVIPLGRKVVQAVVARVMRCMARSSQTICGRNLGSHGIAPIRIASGVIRPMPGA